jgi:hypothetical protein
MPLSSVDVVILPAARGRFGPISYTSPGMPIIKQHRIGDGTTSLGHQHAESQSASAWPRQRSWMLAKWLRTPGRTEVSRDDGSGEHV